MASRAFKIVLGTVAVLTLGGVIAAVHIDNARMRQQLGRLQGQHQQAERTRDENRQLQEIVTRAQADSTDGARAIHADVLRAQTEVEELERKARATYAQRQTAAAQDEASLATNRDPEKGLMRLEHFANQGQATPAAAFQTFVWAAMKGEDATLADMIALDAAAREKGKATLAALPEETRAKYPTPEKLVALFFAAALTGQPSAQILDVAFSDPAHAIVHVRGLTDKTQKVPMQLGAQGWQIVVPEGMAERLGSWASGKAASPSGKP